MQQSKNSIQYMVMSQPVIEAGLECQGTVFTTDVLRDAAVKYPEFVEFRHDTDALYLKTIEKLPEPTNKQLEFFADIGKRASMAGEHVREMLKQGRYVIEWVETPEGKTTIRSISLVSNTQHSLVPDWWKNFPHPKQFNQGNSTICPYCHMVLRYTYYKKGYGISGDNLSIDDEIQRCQKYAG